MISQPQKMKSESKKDRSARRKGLLSALLGGLLHGLLCFFLSDFIFSPFFSYALTQIAIVLGWLLIAGTGVLLLFRPREKIFLRSLLHFGGFFFFFLLKILFFTDRNLPFWGAGNKQCGWPFDSDLSFSLFSRGNSDPFGLPFGCFLPENAG